MKKRSRFITDVKSSCILQLFKSNHFRYLEDSVPLEKNNLSIISFYDVFSTDKGIRVT